MVSNEFLDEAMVMLAYGFKHMQAEGASPEEITKTIRSINSALWQFSDICINNGDTSHSTNKETP